MAGWLAAVLMLGVSLAGAQECPWGLRCHCSSNRALVQCSATPMLELLNALRAANRSFELVYVSNSSSQSLMPGAFRDISIQNLQLSRCQITALTRRSFEGLETSLESLTLDNNKLETVPSAALEKLRMLKSLDLSKNLIRSVPDGALQGHKLQTLKLSYNELELGGGTFLGLEGSLKNLAVQGANLREVPAAVRGLWTLNYLDLAENLIADVGPHTLTGLNTLTALNLERNHISALAQNAFTGVNRTLNSLSLLHNRLHTYPLEALAVLGELRVLDLGFNNIRNLPTDAFVHNPYLTLLALDGNPLKTLHQGTFQHLKGSLRGLSLGGAKMTCDCGLRWVMEWMQTSELQITSRERSPQFCGQPDYMRHVNLAESSVEVLRCESNRTTKLMPLMEASELRRASAVPVTKLSQGSHIITDRSDDSAPAVIPAKMKVLRRSRSSVVVEWQPNSRNILGFQVLYRYFGEREFRHGPSLLNTDHQFALDGLPQNECIVVCVVSLEDLPDITVDNVQPSSCIELAPDKYRLFGADKIVIVSSAIICGIIIFILLLIIFCLMRSPKGGAKKGGRSLRDMNAEWDSGSSIYSTRGMHMFHLNGQGDTLPQESSVSHIYAPEDKHYSHHSTHNGFGKPPPIKQPQFHRRHSISEEGDKEYKGHRTKSSQSSSQQSSTEYESDWITRPKWKDHEVDVYIGHNHVMAPPHSGPTRYKR